MLEFFLQIKNETSLKKSITHYFFLSVAKSKNPHFIWLFIDVFLKFAAGYRFYRCCDNQFMISTIRLNECICDFRFIKCTIMYAFYEPLTSWDPPYYIVATEVKQQRAPDSSHSAEIYSPNIMCPATGDRMYSPGGLTCSRQRLDDATCQKRRCKGYSIDFTGTPCSLSCVRLIFESEYELKISYDNFGDFPTPVEDGMCPEKSDNTTVKSVSSARLHNINNTAFSDAEEGSVSNRDVNEESSGFSFSIPLLAGTGGVVLLEVVIVVSCTLARAKGEKQGRNNGGSTTVPDPSTTSPDLKNTDDIRALTESPKQDDLERVIYHTLDEMADTVDHTPILDECDDQGYNIISDYHKNARFSGGPRDKTNRPLPRPPNVQTSKKFNRSGLSTDSSTGKSLSLRASNFSGKSTSLRVSNSSAGTDVSSVKPPSYLSTLEDPASPKDLVSSLPPPRPHVRLVNLENLKYMGLVKLRQDQAMFGQETEVKLIQTQEGSLELVNVQEELPAFMEYYTNLQLIKQKDGSIGVVGLLDLHAESAGNDSPASQPFPNKRSEYAMLTCSPYINAVERDDAEDKSPSDHTDQWNPYILYFGSVELDKDVKVNPCDYLSVRDIDLSDISARSDGYLTVKDLENIYVSTTP